MRCTISNQSKEEEERGVRILRGWKEGERKGEATGRTCTQAEGNDEYMAN
jgi:hypothetical protein